MNPSPPPPVPAPHTVPKGRARKPRLWRKAIPWTLGAGLLALIIFGLRPRPLEVETADVSRGMLTVSVEEEGKTRIRHRYLIASPVAGMLQRVEWRAGARIAAGKTVLASLEAEPSSFLNPRARAEAEARVQAAEAIRMQRDTQIQRAGDALRLATSEFARARELKKTGAIALREWEAAETEVNLLTRELHAAEFALRVAEFEIAQAQAALMQAQGPASAKSEPYRILSPVDGFVLNVMEESARVVLPGTAIMEVGDPTDLEVEIELLSSDAVAVSPGAGVSIGQWGGAQPLRGKVSMVEPGGYTKISALGVEEQRVKVRVDFIDPLPSGQPLGDRFRVEGRIQTWRGDDVLQVPTGALFRRGNDWMTFVLEGSTARLRTVAIEHNNGTAAQVLRGLSPGERVVLHPPDDLTEGSTVTERLRQP
jgi:HlyD family secretion protein